MASSKFAFWKIRPKYDAKNIFSPSNTMRNTRKKSQKQDTFSSFNPDSAHARE
jgi:hypothetical protein